jgi:alpha-tubulin suppressor-like RCC1 family protein
LLWHRLLRSYQHLKRFGEGASFSTMHAREDHLEDKAKGSGNARTLDDEIDEWEHENEQELQQEWSQQELLTLQALERESESKLLAREKAIMNRLFGKPSTGEERPPTRWSKPASHLQFYAEAEFLRRTPRLSETIFASERDSVPTPPNKSEPAAARVRGMRPQRGATRHTNGQSTSSPSPNSPQDRPVFWPGAKDWLRGIARKASAPTLRRSRSQLAMIEETGNAEDAPSQSRDRAPASRGSQSVDRGLWSRGSRRSDGSSSAGLQQASTNVSTAARSLFSSMRDSLSRGTTPQTPNVARKYGEMPESSPSETWGWSMPRTPASGRNSSRGGIRKIRSESTIHADSPPRSVHNGIHAYEQLILEAEPEVPAATDAKLERIKIFDEKTGKWKNKRRDVLVELAKDGEGHGDTVYPRIPQVFQDHAHTVADALLHANTAEETKMVLDQIAMDVRPGGNALGQVDFEASVGLVLTDDFHGVIVELIEAGSSASECKGITRGDYILEVNDSNISNKTADQVETMLIGKEGTTVTLVVQTGLFGKLRSISLLRRSLGDGLKQAPKEYFRREDELMTGFGYNEFGQLNHGHVSDTSAPVAWEKKKMAAWELKGRIQQVACGWYHTFVVTKKKWTVSKPILFNTEEAHDDSVISTLEIATILAEWATPAFCRTARKDTELPDDAGELMELFNRKELVGMYFRMVESGMYGSAKKYSGTFACGLNKSGQLGLGHKDNVTLLQPIEGLIGQKVDLVACGGHHTLILMQTGAVLAFGANKHGQLGNATVFDAMTPQIVPALTHESTRNPAINSPSRILLVTNLQKYVRAADVKRAFETCFGFQRVVMRSEDKTAVPGVREEGERDRPCALIYFTDVLTSAHAMKKFQGKVLGEQFVRLPMHIFFFHAHQAGSDWMAWIRSRMHRTPCLLPTDCYVKQLSAGYDHSMALLSNGQVCGWGHNNWGQVGIQPLPGLDPEILLRMKELPDDPLHIQTEPAILPFTSPEPGGSPAKVKFMAVGGNHNLFLLEDGRVMACGRNDRRQLGLGPASGRLYHSVENIVELNKYDVRTLCAGASHSLAVLYNGKLLSWGRNDSFQCGHFDTNGYDISIPREIDFVWENGKTVVSVVANEHTILVCQEFEIFVWGLNKNGQLGLADTRVHKLRAEPATWSKRGVHSQPLVGAFHTLVFNRMPLVSGAYQYEDCVYSWGYNKHGELGLGYTSEVYRTIAVGAKIPSLVTSLHMRHIEIFATGWYHTLCIYHDGQDLRRQSDEPEPDDKLPDGMVRGKLPPERVQKVSENPAGEILSMFQSERPKQHLMGWGYNRRGQLGLGHSESQDKPVVVDVQKWGIVSRITQIHCGGMSSYIVTENHDVFAFGSNSKGQLGIGEGGGRQKTPVKIKRLSGKYVKNISAGYDHCVAMVRNLAGILEVYSWGANGFGQLGLGHNVDTDKPTYVSAFTKLQPHSVTCGGQHTIAVTGDSVWSMGRNDYGQLGLSYCSSLNSVVAEPTKISFLSHATTPKTTKYVACGAQHTLFILKNGELLGCGRNDSGQLGLGHLEEAISKPTWILTEKMLNNNRVIGVTASDHTIVSLSNGEAIGCGCNHNGQLGLGHTILSADFQTLPIDSMRADIRAGAYHSFVVYRGPHPRRARNASKLSAANSGVCAVS